MVKGRGLGVPRMASGWGRGGGLGERGDGVGPSVRAGPGSPTAGLVAHCSPSQDTRSARSLKPGRHVHRKLPTVLWQEW